MTFIPLHGRRLPPRLSNHMAAPHHPEMARSYPPAREAPPTDPLVTGPAIHHHAVATLDGRDRVPNGRDDPAILPVPHGRITTCRSSSTWSTRSRPILFPDRSQAEVEIGETILLYVRLPRVLLALLIGASLAVVGVALQALLRNPLADPYVLGISSGSALGASLALSIGIGHSLVQQATVPFWAFVGGIAAMARRLSHCSFRGTAAGPHPSADGNHHQCRLVRGDSLRHVDPRSDEAVSHDVLAHGECPFPRFCHARDSGGLCWDRHRVAAPSGRELESLGAGRRVRHDPWCRCGACEKNRVCARGASDRRSGIRERHDRFCRDGGAAYVANDYRSGSPLSCFRRRHWSVDAF